MTKKIKKIVLGEDVIDAQGPQGEQGLQGDPLTWEDLTPQQKDSLKGEPGDSVIVGEGDLPLAHVMGMDNEKAISQMGVTEEVTFFDEIDLSGSNIITKEHLYISPSTSKWTGSSSTSATIKLVPVTPGQTIAITANSNARLPYAFLTSDSTSDDASFVQGTSINTLAYGEKAYVTVPATAAYLYLRVMYNGSNSTPSRFAYPKSVKQSILDIEQDVEGKTASIWDMMVAVDDVLPEDNYAIYINGTFGTSTSYKHTHVAVKAGDIYYVKATNGSNTLVAFATSSSASSGGDIPLVNGTSVMFVSMGECTMFTIPSGCTYLLVYNGGNARPFNIRRSRNATTIRPKFTYSHVANSSGEIGGNYYEQKIISTPRFIKTNSDFVLTSSVDIRVRLYWYDKSFGFMGCTADDSRIAVTANTPASIIVPSGTEYVKLALYGTESPLVNFDGMPVIQLTGLFPDKWDMFNVRTSDGYQRIVARVLVTDPTSCDEETATVQDEGSYMPDYGIIALPTTYNNTGEPTRLIIYCHGAAVNYVNSVIRFNTQDLEPDYWLAEGYAVMDIEGNPFNNVDEHMQTPQAMDSYVAGYKWAIEHFNLRRDGVFIGGRSMGGGTTFTLMRRDCSIPVIAACPNVPAAMSIFGSIPERKSFFAEHCGFILPEGFTFGSGLIAAEKPVYLSNWDRWIKATPIFNFIIDLPVGDTEKQDFIDMIYRNDSDELKAWFESRHAIAKCPVKLFGCNQDTTCPPNTTSKRYYRMFLNGGQRVECRIFNSYKDYSGTGTSAHHYDTQDENLRADVTTRYGEELTDVPIVYIEMLKFWRRYEQEI